MRIARENFHLLQTKLAEQRSDTNFSKSSTNVTFIQSNLLESLPAGLKVDIMLANLPYIPSGRIPQLANSVRAFEPLLALDGGQDGLQLIHQLLHQANSVMKKKGVCWLEIDDTHTTESILADKELIAKGWRVETLKDSFGRTRFARCYLGLKLGKNTR